MRITFSDITTDADMKILWFDGMYLHRTFRLRTRAFHRLKKRHENLQIELTRRKLLNLPHSSLQIGIENAKTWLRRHANGTTRIFNE